MSSDTTAPAEAIKGVLVDPPLGVVKIDLTGDRVAMQFSNAHVESFPASAVGVIGHNAHSVALNWGGTPVVIRCADATDIDRIIRHANVFDIDQIMPEDTVRSLRLGFEGLLAG